MPHMWIEILEQPDVLIRCFDSNKDTITHLVNAIEVRDIHSVIIAARGTSGHVGIYGKYMIEHEIGLPVSLAAPSIFTVYRKEVDMSRSLVIGISQSGKAEDVLEVIRNANQCGAITVSVTNNLDSALANTAQFHLYCNAGIEQSVAATKTCTTQMYLLAQLVAEWGRNEQFKKELALVPAHISEMFKGADRMAGKMERYRFMDECFVLARGMNYAIAMEAALKIQETSYVRARAYATSDFHHGPFAMIQKDMPVLVFAPNGPTLNDVSVMIEKLKQNEAEVIVVSNNKELLDKGDCAFQIPDTDNDMISPFYNVVISQVLSCQLSLLKNLNPDSPRGLNKITITI